MAEALKPAQIVGSMIELGWAKTTMPVGQLLVRSGLAGALLGVATTLAFAATAQTGVPLVGALIFAVLMYVVLTSAGHDAGGPIGDKLRAAVAARSAGYAAIGIDGLLTVFVKAMLCNWLVCLGVTMAIAAPTVAGKVIGCWLPILTFFGQGFEHTVVNMSLFPLGLMMGAKATVGEYLLSNEIPVTIGNLVGGFLFTGLALYLAYQNREARTAPMAMPEGRPALL